MGPVSNPSSAWMVRALVCRGLILMGANRSGNEPTTGGGNWVENTLMTGRYYWIWGLGLRSDYWVDVLVVDLEWRLGPRWGCCGGVEGAGCGGGGGG